MRNTGKYKRTYCILALLLAISMLGANLTTLSYAVGDLPADESAVTLPICGKNEHTHIKGTCWFDVCSLTCEWSTETPHVHQLKCIGEEKQLICTETEREAHAHTEECVKVETLLICDLEEGTESAVQPDGSPHTHVDDCYSVIRDVVCGKEETKGHIHAENCYGIVPVSLCGLAEGEIHVHDDATCYVTEPSYICQLEEHCHEESCYAAEGSQGKGTAQGKEEECSLQLTEGTVQDERGLVEISGMIPVGTSVVARDLTADEYPRLSEFVDLNTLLFAYDISIYVNNEEYQPVTPVSVTINPAMSFYGVQEQSVTIQHILFEDGQMYVEEVGTAMTDGGAVTFSADSFSIYIGTITTASGLFLESGVGYRFYNSAGTAVQFGYTEWTAAMTFMVKPDPGYKLTAITVAGEDGSQTTATVALNQDGTYTITFPAPGNNAVSQKITVTAEKAEYTGSVIYFDLSAGDITIDGDSYKGARYNSAGETETVEGTRTGNQYYYVYQSNGQSGVGFLNGTYTPPTHAEVMYNGQAWYNYIENNSEVNTVISAWKTAAVARTATPNRIAVTGQVNTTLVIENIWSNHHVHGQGRTTGGISFIPGSVSGSNLTIYCKGDNRVGNIFYLSGGYSGSAGNMVANNQLILDGDVTSSLTVADMEPDGNMNWWDAAIGANDNSNSAIGIVINGGNIWAGTTEKDDCTAIGGGGNGIGHVTINGGVVTASVHSSGAAIGGGIGKESTGGQGIVTINDGKVYAYNASCDSYSKTGSNQNHSTSGREYIPAAAIGGGSSAKATCNASTVRITGGTVYAQTVGGTAIGGGSSADNHGGDATIIITGGTITAKSLSGEIRGQTVPAGVAIGGGTGGALESGAGGTTGVAARGGNAFVTITGGTITTGSIGGGDTVSKGGNIGYAEILVSGGMINGQFVMAAGGTKPCSMTMTGGTISGSNTDNTDFYHVQQNGGAVYMDDPDGTVTISGGTIQNCVAELGGAVYMTAGCFALSGTGTITACTADNGGAVYMGGGVIAIKGGSISNNRAANNGGGAYVNNGTIIMSGGEVSSNTAVSGSGGGMYVISSDGEDNADIGVTVYSGTISDNLAQTSGGAIAVVGGGAQATVQIGLHENHTGSEISHTDLYGTYIHKSCPVVTNNQVTAGGKGGAVYIDGDDGTQLLIYCLTEQGNQVGDGNSLSNFMMVEGGKVTISSAKSEPPSGMNDEDDHDGGQTAVHSSMYVVGGKVDLYGVMNNPSFGDRITVDVEAGTGDYFFDHRVSGIDEIWYKVLYFENFQDSGQYTEVQIKAGTQTKILGSIYSHDGYEMKGWNTSRNPNDPNADQKYQNTDHTTEVDGWYRASDEAYTFNGAPIGDLTLYAIWEARGYTIKFDPGVSTYTGNMAPVRHAFNVETSLPLNQFGNPGHDFVGWSRTKGAAVPDYLNGQKVTNLTTVDGATVPLYAVWDICTHTAQSNAVITYTAVGDMMTKSCSCDGMNVTVRLIPQNVIYDGNGHGASWEYVGAASLEQMKFWTSTQINSMITYEGMAESGTPYVRSAEKPVNAGAYTAYLIATNQFESDIEEGVMIQQEVNACVGYIISKAEQPAPAAPSFSVSGNQLTVAQVDPSVKTQSPYSDTKIRTKYQLYYYLSTGEAQSDEENETGVFTLKTDWTRYYVMVWYSEGDNHWASEKVRSQQTHFKRGDTEISFDLEEGILIEETPGETTGLQIKVSADEARNFYLKKELSVEITTTRNGQTETGTATFTLQQGSTDMKRMYLLNNIPQSENDSKYVIVITIRGVSKAASMLASVTEKQIFGSFAGDTEAAISRDSAYTANFRINNYDPAVYAAPTLTFGTSPPAGTTIIMVDKSGETPSYWYCSNMTIPLALSSFTAMGGTQPYSLPEDTSDLEYQFIVDFSRCPGELLSGSLTMTLDAPKIRSDNVEVQPNAPELKQEVMIELVALPAFNISMVSVNGLTVEMTLTYTESSAAASKWDNRDAVVMITPDTEIPADAVLKVTEDGKTTELSRAGNGGYILPLNSIRSRELAIELVSGLIPENGGTFAFTVSWYISNSLAGEAPFMGTPVTTHTLSLTADSDKLPSLRISGDRQLAVVGEDVVATVEWKNIDAVKGSVMAEVLMKDASGKYSKTSWQKNISLTAENGTGVNKATLVIGTANLFPVGVEAQSYCLRLTVKEDIDIVLEVPYYFIIAKS